MRFQHGELHLVILALLNERPMHGYELMGELNRRLGRRYRASPGSIYPAVQALEDEGLIEAQQDDDRRAYRLTAEGSAALKRRADRLAELEHRLGITLSNDLDSALARFAARVRGASVDQDVVERVLDRAVSEIVSHAKKGRRS